MRNPILPLRIFLFSCLCAAGLRAAPIQHEFIAIDEGLTNLLYVNEKNPAKNWLVPIGREHPRDMQLVGGNRILIGHERGYTEFDIATGKVMKDVSSFSTVTSVRRLPNGDSLLTGTNLDGSTGVVVVEVDANNHVKYKIVYPGDYVRLMRETAKGTYLLVCDTKVIEGDTNGVILWSAPVDKFSHAWKALRLANGHTLASAGYGAFMVDLDATGAVARKFGAMEDVPAAIHPDFYAMFQLLANGDVVVANWQGHGPGHGSSGVQILEYDAKGAIVWQWSKADIISSIQGVLVLDGLDTALLHDERNGVMEPLRDK